MTRKYYAGSNSYGVDFSYDSGWTVFVFDSKQERDNFVADAYNEQGNQTHEIMSRHTSRKISGSDVKETLCNDGIGSYLEPNNKYYNAHYWGWRLNRA